MRGIGPVVFWILRTFKRGSFAFAPTYIKRYPVGAKLENEIWIPSAHQADTKLPLFIDIHGGGFVLGAPRQDAGFCHYLAEEHGICVVSVNYPKAPRVPYPYLTDELAKVVQCVLDDSSLPVDTTNVAIGGFSAGGNLSLSMSLRNELQGKFKGVLAWYPVTDFSGRFKSKPNMPNDMGDMFDYAYVKDGQNLCDPYLSPVYGDRKRLPPKIFLLGAEFDVLCNEAEQTALRYAGAEEDRTRKGDPYDWTIGNIKWRKIPGVQHGFNFIKEKDPESEKRRLEITQTAYKWSAEWLKEEVFTIEV
jgi:acetyl esterase/lipase